MKTPGLKMLVTNYIGGIDKISEEQEVFQKSFFCIFRY